MKAFPRCRLTASVLACALLAAACGDKEVQGTPLDATGQQETPIEERIGNVIQPLIDGGWSKGMVVGVVQNGRQSHFSFGSLGDDAETRPDGNTVFEIGSVTKVFTALVLADMAVKGEVSLDDPVAGLLPKDWQVPSPGGQSITLADLAAHISGLPNIPANFWREGDKTFDPVSGGLRWKEFSAQQFEDYFANPAPPLGERGRYVYSNLGVGLLGHALARKSEKSLDSLIAERICRPLGMDDTSFELKTSGPGHDVDGVPTEPWSAGDSVLRGAFALRSTSADMLKFAAATLDPAASSLEETLKLAIRGKAKINEMERTALGWRVNKFGVIYTTGATGGFRCALYLYPQSRTAVVLLANTQVGGVTGSRAGLFDALGGSLLNVVLGIPPLEIRFPAPVPNAAEKLADYPGHYSPENGAKDPSFPIRVENGKLIMVGPGGVAARLWPAAEDAFFTRAYQTELRFLRDKEAKVTGADLDFEGRKARLKRNSFSK